MHVDDDYDEMKEMEVGATASTSAYAAAAMVGAAGLTAVSVAGRRSWWRGRRWRRQVASFISGSGDLIGKVAAMGGSLVQEIGVPQHESPRTSHARDSLHSPTSDLSLPLSSYLLSGV